MGVIDGNDRVISLKLSDETISNNILQTLYFYAALGSDTTTALSLTNVKSTGDSILVTSQVGRFTLAGVCLEGGVARLLNTTGKVALNLIKPNPSSDKVTIEYEVIESGKTELYLVNTFGEKVLTILSKETTIGIYTIDVNVKDLGTGMYFIVLETPTVRKAEKLEIVR